MIIRFELSPPYCLRYLNKPNLWVISTQIPIYLETLISTYVLFIATVVCSARFYSFRSYVFFNTNNEHLYEKKAQIYHTIA